MKVIQALQNPRRTFVKASFWLAERTGMVKMVYGRNGVVGMTAKVLRSETTTEHDVFAGKSGFRVGTREEVLRLGLPSTVKTMEDEQVRRGDRVLLMFTHVTTT